MHFSVDRRSCEVVTAFLTPEHLKYLQHIEVPASAVLDARNMQRAVYQAELKRQNKALSYVANSHPVAGGQSVDLKPTFRHSCAPLIAEILA